MDLDKLKRKYVRAKKAYYESEPIMSDAEFDALEGSIREADPKWAELHKTGVRTINKKTEVELTHFMPSLAKAYPEHISKWFQKNVSNKYVVMPKLDGGSLQLTYTGGKPTRLVTRGNGVLGKDISFLIPQLNLPTLKTKTSFVARCEAVMKRATFERKYAKDYDNPRNLVNGLLNRKDGSPILKDVDVVVLGVFNTPLKQTLSEKGDGLIRVSYELSGAESPEKMSALLDSIRKSCPYEIDGLVVAPSEFVMNYGSSDRPKNIVAFKVNSMDDAVTAKVVKIIYQVSGRARIIPKVLLEPVRVAGVTVKHATAHNAEWMKANKLGPGAVVTLVRSGGVIPKIIGVKKPGKFQPPEISHKMDGVHFVVHDADDHTQRKIDVNNVVKFMKTLGIELIAGKTAELLHPTFPTPIAYIQAWAGKGAVSVPRPGLFGNARVSSFKDALIASGVGRVMSDKIQSEFDRVLGNEISMRKLMVATQIFGVGIGDRKLEQIEAAGVTMEAITTVLDKDQLIRCLKQVHGFSSKTISVLVKGMAEWRRFYKAVNPMLKINGKIKPKKKPTSGPLSGELVTFTSYRDKDHEAAVMAAGAVIVPFGSKTTILLYKKGGKVSSKIASAKAKGIRVSTFEELKL